MSDKPTDEDIRVVVVKDYQGVDGRILARVGERGRVISWPDTGHMVFVHRDGKLNWRAIPKRHLEREPRSKEV